MPMPESPGAIDLMIALPPKGDPKAWYEFLKAGLHDRESLEEFEFPAQYMFHEVPHIGPVEDPVGFLLDQMDAHGIAKGMLGVSNQAEESLAAIAAHPDRFFGSFEVDPNQGMDGVRALEHAVKELGVKAATAFPAGYTPQVPINDKKMYPLYAKCVELDVPMVLYVGVPGPRILMSSQEVAQLDEVCWFFPELKLVTRHGGEPWQDLMVKLLLKWPNLYYSTSAFAPKHYPQAIVDYANTRGADKILYAGYYAAGLSLDRIFEELPGVPFRDHVWPKFLHENATRVFKLDE